jgi:hypothetical protein
LGISLTRLNKRAVMPNLPRVGSEAVMPGLLSCDCGLNIEVFLY